MPQLSIAIAFFAGVLSFASPCVLPLIPGFLVYLAGTTKKEENARIKMFLSSLAFVLGFSIIFALLGILLNTVLQSISYAVQTWLSRIGGIIIILFALYILRLIKINFLERDHKFSVKSKWSNSYITSFIFGAAFAVGWTPCVGAILGSVLALAISNPAHSFILLLAYSLGLGIPFLVVGIFTAQTTQLIAKSERILKYFNLIVGILLLIIGILVFTNQLNIIANLLTPVWLLK